MSHACRICGNEIANVRHLAREMMLGLGDEFEYLECSACGTLQLIEVPDLQRYYPPNYYSFKNADGPRDRIAGLLARFYLKLSGGPGYRVVSSVLDLFDFEARVVDRGLGVLSVLRLNLDRTSRILDVGCGSGKLLEALKGYGFRSVTGIDPFLEGDQELPDGVRLLKRDIAALEGKFDLIMFHHSFEHLADPGSALRHARRLLGAGGKCLVRIPLVNRAWERYGVNWVGLDAPRHIFLFTERSFRLLAERCGFEVNEVVYDSTSFQFSASEQYLTGVTLTDPKGEGMFTRRQIARWSNEARQLNREGRGDQAAFYLRLKDQ